MRQSPTIRYRNSAGAFSYCPTLEPTGGLNPFLVAHGKGSDLQALLAGLQEFSNVPGIRSIFGGSLYDGET